MKITLFDVNPDLCEAWRKEFKNCKDVTVAYVPVSGLDHHSAIVAPGNSFGVMTGGIDMEIRNIFGFELQDVIQNEILSHAELLPVGQALYIPTLGAAHDAVIYAPTMFSPRRIPSMDVVYATMVSLSMAMQQECQSIAIPGFGTGSGGVEPQEAAKAMRIGYDSIRRLMKDGKAG